MSLREKLLPVHFAASLMCACYLSQMNGREDFVISLQAKF